jgi:carboxymethylenebutenolidase
MLVTVEALEVPVERGKLSAYYARPTAAGTVPGLVILHEIFGLNDNLRGITWKFAAEGYAALAVDLFHGQSGPVCIARHLFDQRYHSLDNRALRDLEATLTFLRSLPAVDSNRLGAVGFCLGAGYAIAWSCIDPRLKAIAPFYGKNPRPLSKVREACPIVASYPVRDTVLFMGTHRDGHALKAELAEDPARQGKDDVRHYPGTNHSFWNARYDLAAVEHSFLRVLDFFRRFI